MTAQAKSDWSVRQDSTFVGTVGDVVERFREDRIELGLQTEEQHRNLSGIVHGGVVMTLVDRAISLNCRAAAPGERLATANLSVNFLRQIKVGEFVHVTSRVRKTGRKALFAEADIWVNESANGDPSEAKLVATASGIWMKVA